MQNLWWRIDDPEWIEGLEEKLEKKELFSTIRFGTKWYRKLTTGEVVEISVTDDVADPRKNKLGEAKVVSLLVGPFGHLKRHYPFLLEENIGTKDWDQALKAIAEVYVNENVTEDSDITIIGLCAV